VTVISENQLLYPLLPVRLDYSIKNLERPPHTIIFLFRSIVLVQLCSKLIMKKELAAIPFGNCLG